MSLVESKCRFFLTYCCPEGRTCKNVFKIGNTNRMWLIMNDVVGKCKCVEVQLVSFTCFVFSLIFVGVFIVFLFCFFCCFGMEVSEERAGSFGFFNNVNCN